MNNTEDLVRAIKIINGICPNCDHRKTMHDNKGLLWCPNCDSSYDETEFVQEHATTLVVTMLGLIAKMLLEETT